MKLLFIFSLLCNLIFLYGCSSKQLEYSDFNHLDHWSQLEQVEDGLVIIYFYVPSCPTCMEIKDEVLLLAKEVSKTHYIYLIDAGMIHEQGAPSFDIPSTPAIIVLQDRELLEIHQGPFAVVDYLSIMR